MELQDKTILITGAARRIGRAMAEDLARRGARIAIHFNLSSGEARNLKASIESQGGMAETFPADLSRFEQLSTLVSSVVKRFGHLDVLINNASIFERTPIEGLSESDWDRHLDINLKAPFFLSRDAALQMRSRGQGKIINIADAAVRTPWPGYLPYAISKSALVTMSQGLARVFAPEVQINCIGPGTVIPPPELRDDDLARSTRHIPLNRFGDPSDVVHAVRFLLEDGDYITGAFISIDGGASLL